MHGHENKDLFHKETEMSVKKSESWPSNALAKANKILLITKANTKI